ncbi:PEP-CTERM sorting domain-containing protein [Azohydromonas australica]|uniref:PEP-CTERM sorting domain-containing protein n=1 Tax=Azohydromonas australica TaxID=364039 RepID=UPI000A06BDC6|nr:PEP-CTERM sorting domain-containing protein [Azohydromonas australica]
MVSRCPVSRSCITPVLSAAIAAAALLASPASGVELVINSGPLVRHELFRSDGPSELIWEELAFTFHLPDTARGNGLLRLFAGGDLNNIGIDWIDATAGPFDDRTLLGTYAFPVSDTHFTACENPPHTNPAGCPLPETVPGGLYYDPSRGPPVGDVEGRRDVTMFSPGVRGLVVPQSLLTGGSSLTISLFPHAPIFDLYIDRIELSYPPIPEPATQSLMLAGLALVGGLAWRSRRRP